MFTDSQFNQPLDKWNVSNVQTMDEMFYISDFNQDISNWKINSSCDTDKMFDGCSIEDKYKPYQNGNRIN